MNARTDRSGQATREHASGRRVDAIARSRGGIGQALRRAEAYLSLNARLREKIPQNARGAIAVACVDGDCLVIAAASSARATQARLLASALLDEAQVHWPEKLNRTRVIIAPGLNLEP